MLLYNGSRVHNAKYELVVGLASASGLCVWFLFWFKNDPGASLDTVEVNADGCQPDRLPGSVGADGVYMQLRN